MFERVEDIWEVIDLLVDEVIESNKKGESFDVTASVSAQMPFFSCYNNIINKDIQKDIQRYIYTTETNVPPYEGDYGKQPALWVDKFFIIKEALAKYEKRIIDANSKKHKH